ncbi:Protein phosphatase 2C 2 [Entomophthora muscae]|uniref:Protein phosphatase 2C 2 n=1 Tax=Entomophthora muscae TaxID=34485 RepID=A0ACC2UBA6_9FUNG|nr:Protein phosphatase 2C 2 [Entomophthora muscae]
MGQTLSAPVTEKYSDEGSNDKYSFGSSCMQGWRVSMEDAHTTLLSLEHDSDAAFFAVFDGHGGRSAAKFSGIHLAERIQKESGFLKGEYAQAIKAGFLGLDYDLKTDPDFLDDVSGCTAVCTLFTNDKRIFCGNAGDSRAILSVNGVVKELSFDHKPQNTEEYARIYNAGGFVEYGRVNGNLALSRAIGDFEFKQNLRLNAEEQAVTSNPDITEHKITEEDEFIVIACDGIWDCMSSQDVITFVREQVAKGITLKQICENLMENCLAPASDYGGLGCDNMTVLIVAILNGKSYSEWANMVTSRVAESAPAQAVFDGNLSDASTQPAVASDYQDDAQADHSEEKVVEDAVKAAPTETTETTPAEAVQEES